MTDDLMNQVKAQAHAVASRMGSGRWGLITSTRKTDTGYEVRVKLQPEDVLTGWLPVLSPMVGNGWGIVSPPALNNQAFVIPQEGRADHGVVVGMAFNNQDLPPQPGGNAVAEGQFALVHKNGSYLLFNDDDVVLVTNRDLLATVGRDAKVLAKNSLTASAPTVTIDADGQGGNTTVKLDGDLHVTGSVVAGFGTGDQVGLQSHRHGTVGTPVAAQTIPPSPGT